MVLRMWGLRAEHFIVKPVAMGSPYRDRRKESIRESKGLVLMTTKTKKRKKLRVKAWAWIERDGEIINVAMVKAEVKRGWRSLVGGDRVVRVEVREL